jgi:enoyl-CoA hydratase/carnithine racemase
MERRVQPLSRQIMVARTPNGDSRDRQLLCVDREALLAEADAIVDQMIECNPLALRLLKRDVRRGADTTPEQVEKMKLLADEVAWSHRGKADGS